MKEEKILKEISKDAKVGIDGIDFVLKKAKDSEFKNLLYSQKDKYQGMYERTKNILMLNNSVPEDNPPMQKAMSWMGVQMSTLTNTSDSKLAEILIQGNDMGIISGTKLLNNVPKNQEDVRKIVKDFVDLQQENIVELKRYL